MRDTLAPEVIGGDDSTDADAIETAA
jgi:hypothetical protein